MAKIYFDIGNMHQNIHPYLLHFIYHIAFELHTYRNLVTIITHYNDINSCNFLFILFFHVLALYLRIFYRIKEVKMNCYIRMEITIFRC